MNTIEYLDAYKAATGKTSDYGVAKALGISHQAVSKWRNGIDSPGPMQAFKIAEALALDPAVVVADMERERAERAGKVDQAGAWRGWLEKLTGVAAAALVGLFLSAPTPAESRASAQGGSSESHCYVKQTSDTLDA